MSVTFPISYGLVEIRNDSALHSFTPYARHARATECWRSPADPPSAASTSASRPASSAAASTSWPRSRGDPAPAAGQFNNVVKVESTRSAIRVFATPSAASSTVRARFAAEAATTEARAQRSNSSRSPRRRTSSADHLCELGVRHALDCKPDHPRTRNQTQRHRPLPCRHGEGERCRWVIRQPAMISDRQALQNSASHHY